MSKKTNKKSTKLTDAQRKAKIEAARKREEDARKKQERAETRKRIFTIVVCIVLVLALGVPTVALQFMATTNNTPDNANENAANTEQVANENGEGNIASSELELVDESGNTVVSEDDASSISFDENGELIIEGGEEDAADDSGDDSNS